MCPSNHINFLQKFPKIPYYSVTMDTISKAKKLQFIKSNPKTLILQNIAFWSFVAFITCSLLCIILCLPNMLTSFSSPKFFFIVINVIVIFLIGESKFLGSYSSPTSEIYEEYVKRTTSLRKATILHGKPQTSKEFNYLQEEKVGYSDVEVKIKEKEVIELPKKENQYKELEIEDIKQGEVEEEKGKDMGLPDEELNRRVEEFIARVHKQRLLEDKS